MTDAPDDLVLYEVRDRVATMTLNRPARLNAFNDDLGRAALAAMRRFDLDPEADVAVLTGQFFTAGEALKVNIIDTVSTKGEHIAQAQEIAREIARNPPLGVRHTVQLRRWELKKVQREAVRMVKAAKLNLTEDFQQSARAFVEKRPAGPFKGQ